MHTAVVEGKIVKSLPKFLAHERSRRDGPREDSPDEGREDTDGGTRISVWANQVYRVMLGVRRRCKWHMCGLNLQSEASYDSASNQRGSPHSSVLWEPNNEIILKSQLRA